jgi:hypothetical protein
MFFHLLYIHLFRPFLKYNPSTSPLPSHVSPRKLCTQAAGSISKLMRLYKRTYGLRQICNIAVYIVHSATTIQLLNLPEKTAKRDIIHGVKHLEEIAEDWLCARRTLSILSVLARKWKIELPEEASTVLSRTDAKYGFFSTADVPSPKADLVVQTPPSVTASPSHVQQKVVEQKRTPALNYTQLQQGLYSYPIDTQSMRPNNTSNPQENLPSQYQTNMLSNAQPRQSNGVGNMNISHDTTASAMPYKTAYSNSLSRSVPAGASDLRHSDSAVMSDATSASTSMTRQVSPSTIFGGVDALVESQDWWLRDQASLAVGFDNWMGGGNNADMSGAANSGINISGSAADIDAMTGFYVPPNLNRGGRPGGGGGDIYREDDWTTYT